jgi:hypothetical protein
MVPTADAGLPTRLRTKPLCVSFERLTMELPMLPILLVLAEVAAQAPLDRQWAQFSRAGALSHVREVVEIATGHQKGSTGFPYKLRFTRRTLDGNLEVKWTDSATCPAAPSVIASMQNIKMPSLAPYGVSSESMVITLDGTGYSLTAPSSDNMGKITISSNVGSPLAAWIDATFKKLESCWKATGS